MKKILTAIFILASFSASAQSYIRQNTFYGLQQYRSAIDSTFLFPAGNGAPSGIASLRSINIGKPGLYGDTANKQAYIFWGKDSTWTLIGNGITATDTSYSYFVDSITNVAPSSPVTGRYVLVGTAGSGAFSGKSKNLARWNGSAWVYTPPSTAYTVFNIGDDYLYRYNGIVWYPGKATVHHNLDSLGTTLKIGTKDNENLAFKTNGNTRMILTKDGHYQLNNLTGASNGVVGTQADGTLQNLQAGYGININSSIIKLDTANYKPTLQQVYKAGVTAGNYPNMYDSANSITFKTFDNDIIIYSRNLSNGNVYSVTTDAINGKVALVANTNLLDLSAMSLNYSGSVFTAPNLLSGVGDDSIVSYSKINGFRTIPAGGTPTLQSVTDAGATTTNAIKLVSETEDNEVLSLFSPDSTTQVGGFQVNSVGTTFFTGNYSTSELTAYEYNHINREGIGESTTYTFASDAGSHTLPISVNGNFADPVTGNIIIGGGTQDLQQVTDEGSTSTNDIYVNTTDGGFFVQTSSTTKAGLTSDGEGHVILKNASDFQGVLSVTNITDNRTLQFPDASGTIALTSDIPAAGANATLSNLGITAINASLLPATDDAIDLGSASKQWRDLYLTGSSIYMAGSKILATAGLTLPTGGAVRTSTSAANTTLLQAYDVDGTAYTTFATLTANNTPTMDLSAAVTRGGVTIADISSSQALTNKTYNGNTFTAGTGTLTIAAGKTLLVSNGVTLVGTDGSSVAFGTGGTVLYSGGALGTPSSGTLTNATGYTGANLVLTDVTTNDVSISAHGFFPKLTSNSTYYVNNSGALTPLTVGASGTVLSGNGVTSAPSWTALSSLGFWSLASGGILTGTNTVTTGTNPLIFSVGVTTGTGATAGIQEVYNSLTTGNGLDVSTTSLTTGNLAKFTSTSTAAGGNSQTVVNIATSGANGTATQTTWALDASNTHTGATSTNVTARLTANGGTINQQLITAFSSTEFMSVATGANGNTTFTLNGTSPAFTFANNFIITGSNAINAGSAASNLLTGSQSGTGFQYRTTNGGSNVNAHAFFDLGGNAKNNAGALSLAFGASGTNGAVIFLQGNTTRAIEGAYILPVSEDATAGSEDMRLELGTQAGGAAASAGLVITNTKNIYGTAIHNNATAPTGTTNQYIASGTYTPTLTNVTNITASTAYQCQWIRVGNVVTVSGKVDIDVTLGIASELGMSLPIASNLTAEQNLGGTASSSAAASLVTAVKADATNDRAAFVFTAVSLTNDSYFFEFEYLIQ